MSSLAVVSPAAVAAATVAQTLAGFVFYGPLFARRWLHAMRKDKNDPKYLTTPPDPRNYTVKMVSSVILDAIKVCFLMPRSCRRPCKR
ncbi:hypothetical protein M427DRAFT_34312 [Gonapodya prolifera JEL478]|uniref:Uncharacterized protein n=1 Tax=Gonapodya prolifera (strain JEL478) TaxID=1344416 RepID=A0A139A8F5_GONPJ|nr:hypothetical protein M427DRAFT_34312 [Gonapodya prolifera JEL478]|eukprot:KXS13086.1 hypothetical protein M427DRAFT_34312 [Gonapodya prolifera JEL478]